MGDLLSFNFSADSLGQFEATIINFAASESAALQDCLTPTWTFPVSIADLKA